MMDEGLSGALWREGSLPADVLRPGGGHFMVFGGMFALKKKKKKQGRKETNPLNKPILTTF